MLLLPPTASRVLTGFVLPARCTAASIFVRTSFNAWATARSAAAAGVCWADMAATTEMRLAAMRAMQLLRVCGWVGDTVLWVGMPQCLLMGITPTNCGNEWVYETVKPTTLRFPIRFLDLIY